MIVNLMDTLGATRGPIRGRGGTPRGRTLRGKMGTVTKMGKATCRGRGSTATIRKTVMRRGIRGIATKSEAVTNKAAMRETRTGATMTTARHPGAL